MRIPRFFFDFNRESFLSEGKEFRIFEPEIVHQVRNVLRKDAGNEIALFDGSGKEILVRILGIEKKSILLVERLTEKQRAREPKVQAVLYCSILKKENFELAVQKATELGVKEIFPLYCQRTVKLDFKQERLKKIIKEASQQSGRTFLPMLQKTITFQQSLAAAKANEVNLFFDIGREKYTCCRPCSKIGIFIGPEGGWTEEEASLAKQHKFKIVSLCTLSLRAETAAMAACYAAIWE